MILPTGELRRVRVRYPLGVEQYVVAAQQFAAWVWSTPEQRAAMIRDRPVAASLQGMCGMYVGADARTSMQDGRCR